VPGVGRDLVPWPIVARHPYLLQLLASSIEALRSPLVAK
tara:strand:+ start:56199 stop:56315 length:117 start_codon:yes stop_codon:yes gene_type:complete